jgi:hypothetical protein
MIRGEGGRVRRILFRTRLLRLRSANFLASKSLAQYYESITDLNVGTSDRDVALIA